MFEITVMALLQLFSRLRKDTELTKIFNAKSTSYTFINFSGIVMVKIVFYFSFGQLIFYLIFIIVSLILGLILVI